MGNSNGKDKSEEIVDGGQLIPHGLYKGPQDWDARCVRKFIIDRKLAPFYKGLSDYDENWDEVTLTTHNLPKNTREMKRTATLNSTGTHKGKEINSVKTLEAQLYKGAVECPICFLYYPQNINHSRCCDQPICTECFVQIKRPDNGTLSVNNSPAVCPFCVEPNFGVCYKSPPFSTGVNNENVASHNNSNTSLPLSSSTTSLNQTSSDKDKDKSRRKSVSHKDPEVVTTDQVRPDWATCMLQPRQPLVTRRPSNTNSSVNPRRFVPRPNPSTMGTGTLVTSSASNSRRNIPQDADYSRYLAAMRMGTDLEELMVMEAIRLSLVEQEHAQRREREERERTNGDLQEDSNDLSPSENPIIDTISPSQNENGNIHVNDIDNDDGNDDNEEDEEDDEDLISLISQSLENNSITSTPITTVTEDGTITSTSVQSSSSRGSGPSSSSSTDSTNDHQQINTSA